MAELPPPPKPLGVSVVDAHTHLDACGATGVAGVRAMLDRAAAVGVAAVVTVADDMTSARWVVQASSWDDRVFAAVALHPTRTATMTDADRAELERLARAPRVVAVGETGLDYYWTRVRPRLPVTRGPAGGLPLAHRPCQASRQAADDPRSGRPQ